MITYHPCVEVWEKAGWNRSKIPGLKLWAGFASCHATTLRTFGLIVESMYPDEAKETVLRGRSVSIWHWDGQVIY